MTYWAQRPDRWPASLAWLAEPSFLIGMGSIVDLAGSSRWYDPTRLTVDGSRRALAGDLVVVGRDLRRAADVAQVSTNGCRHSS